MLDEANSKFWDELCGSQAARMLGVSDSSPASLKKFDDWYFQFYPYLTQFLGEGVRPGCQVLEVGLGYGTVSQYIAEKAASYTGLDISPGPVHMVSERLKQSGLPGNAQVGSILSAPFEPESFDCIVAIGSLHHTGDLQKSIMECHRLLRSSGVLLFMVYNAYSYRRWQSSSVQTLKYLSRESLGYRGVVGSSSDRQRYKYDSNEAGETAPHTDWISKRSLASFLEIFSSCTSVSSNIDTDFAFSLRNRESLMKSRWPGLLGLDLYVQAAKGAPKI